MEAHKNNYKLTSGRLSVEAGSIQNLSLNERLISVFLGGAMIATGFRWPLKKRLMYGAYLSYRGFTGHCAVYDKLGIDARHPRAVNIRGEFEIDRAPDEVYRYWRDLNHLPMSIRQLLEVEVIDEKRSHWKSRMLKNLISAEWDAEIVKEETGKLIGWRSRSRHNLISHVGRVTFEPTALGTTILKITLSYHPPGGGVGLGLARAINPFLETLLVREMKSFKDRVERKVFHSLV